MQTNCNEVVVLVRWTPRPAGKEVSGTRKKGVTEILEKKKGEVKVHFKREPLIIFHVILHIIFYVDGHKNKLIGLSVFQSLLWVYGMAWMSVRFPNLKFCPSPPLHHTQSNLYFPCFCSGKLPCPISVLRNTPPRLWSMSAVRRS